MSTNDTDDRSREAHDPTKDKYLEMDKKLGAAEYAVAGDIAAADEALDDAVDAAREHTKSAFDNIRHGPRKRRS